MHGVKEMGAADRSFSVLIPDGESEFALFVMHCLAPYRNVRVHVLSGERWAPPRLSRYCKSYTHWPNGTDDWARLDTIEQVVHKQQIDVLLPTESKWISFVVAHREALSKCVAIVPLPDPAALQVANNKWLLARFLDEHHIPGPPTVLVTYDQAFERQIQEMVFPVLLKPVSAWGGEGIERFERRDDLLRYLEHTDPEQIREHFIVQTMLQGFVVGVNILAREGRMLATTMQRGMIPNTTRYAAAGAIRFVKDARFAAIVQELVTTLRWSGFANLDTFYDSEDDQLKILEINARFWGSLRGSSVAGVSFPYLACLAALGVPFPLPDYELVRYFHPKTALREGVLRLLGKNREEHFGLKESGLQYLLADPLAEMMRALRQASSSPS